jgi:hypothetical protein
VNAGCFSVNWFTVDSVGIFNDSKKKVLSLLLQAFHGLPRVEVNGRLFVSSEAAAGLKIR